MDVRVSREQADVKGKVCREMEEQVAAHTEALVDSENKININ